MRFEISEVMQQDAVMELVFGNCDRPDKLLGRHFVSSGQVISAFHPDAVAMEIVDSEGNHYPMDPIERQPVFAAYFPNKRAFSYQIQMTFQDGNVYISEDPYSFESQISETELSRFDQGRWKNSYRKLGSHVMSIAGCDGVYFAVWAPMARRVSVVGDFNFWNGMIYPMQRIGESGLFEIFLPGVHAGQLYKYEIKNWQGEVFQKTDPYAVMNEKQENGASVIMDLDLFRWDDAQWMSSRNIRDIHSKPLSVCEMFEPELMFPEERLREIVLDMGLSHILLKNTPEEDDSVSEELRDIAEREKLKTARNSFFEPIYSRSGPDRMRSFVNECHKNHMSVLLEITTDYIQRAFNYILEFADLMPEGTSEGLTRLIEESGYTFLFYRSPELTNYILSNLIFWIRKYHIDGFVFHGFRNRMVSVARELQDSGIKNQDWVNLIQRGYDLMEDLMRAARDIDSGILFIGDCIRQFDPLKTGSWVRDLVEPEFDLEWNYMIKSNLDRYLKLDREERKRNHSLLSLPLMRMGAKDNVILLNHEWRKAGSTQSAGSDLAAREKTAYAFLAGMPGKIMWALHAGQDTYSMTFARDLLKIYRRYPALYDFDLLRTPFEWINCTDADHSVISFVRKDPRRRENLLFICNFDSEEKRGYRLGVPQRGKYRMILNSDSVEYGGEGLYEGQEYNAEPIFRDLREYSIKVYLPPLSALVFVY